MREEEMLGYDRLSALPDEILHHILSFLPSTFHRFQTSVLSRRWRYLWMHHPSLHFDPCDPDGDVATVMEYIHSVDKCMQSCQAAFLQRLQIHLILPRGYIPFGADFYSVTAFRWLLFAASRSVRELVVWADKPSGEDAKVPGHVFSCCASLSELSLVMCAIVARPSDPLVFHHLKSLSISLSTMTYDNLRVLLSKCPALESLDLLCCIWLTRLVVTSQKLKELALFECWNLRRVKIRAPSLTRLRMYPLPRVDLKDSPNLVEASVHAGAGGTSYSSWTRLVRALSCAEVLSVDSWFFRYVLAKDPRNGVQRLLFGNLKELHCDIEWLTGSVLCALCSIIGACPALEKLCINFDGFRAIKARNQYYMLPRLRIPLEADQEWHGWRLSELSKLFVSLKNSDSRMYHLKAVRVENFRGTMSETHLLKFLLAKAVSLKKLIVIHGLVCDAENLRKLLEPFCTASLHVQILDKGGICQKHLNLCSRWMKIGLDETCL